VPRPSEDPALTPLPDPAAPAGAEQHTRLLLETSRALLSALTANDVKRVVLEQAVSVTGAYGGTLIRVIDDDTLYTVGSVGYDEPVELEWKFFPPEPRFPVVTAIREGRAVFADMPDLERHYPGFIPLLQPRTRAIAAIPLMAGGKVLSALTLSFAHADDIHPRRQEFMLALVEQCAQALERARLYDAEHLARERATVLSEAGSVLAASLNVQETLSRITNVAIRHVADWAVVYQPDDTGRMWPVAVSHTDPGKAGLLHAFLERFPSNPDVYGTSAWVMRTGDDVLIPVVSQRLIDALPTQEQRDAVRELGFHSMILVPLDVRGRRAGVLGVATTHPSRTYGHDDLSLARELAHRAALALDNAELYEASRASQERYRSLVDATRQTVWTNTPDGQLLGDQPGWASLTGQSREAYSGSGWADAVHPGDRERAVHAWNAALKAGSTYETHQRVRVRDGTYRHYHVRAVPVPNTDGSVREWVGVHTDITEQVQAEQELRDREERYRALVEFAAVGVGRANRDGRWLDVNRAATEFFGYTREELLGMTFLDVTHPDDRDGPGTRKFERLIAGDIDAFEQEKRYVRKDGSVRWASVTVSAVRNEQGEVRYTVAVLNDITERKQAEAQLRASEERFRRLVDASPTGIAVGALDGTLRFPNEAYLRMLGFTRAEFDAGLVNWATVTPAEYRQLDERAFRQAFERGASEPYEKEMLRRDGARFPVGLVLARYDQHDETFVVGYVQDLTVQKDAERTLRNHSAELERRVEKRTRALEEQRAALDAFVTYTEAVGTETDTRALARQALNVLQARFPHASAAYYERDGEVWRARVWTDNMRDDVVSMIQAGVPSSIPLFARSVEKGREVFVDAWNPEDERVDNTDEYGAGAAYPLRIAGDLSGMLAVGLKNVRQWSERDRAVVRAVGRSLTLALERAEQTARVEAQRVELDARTRVLEAFASFTRDLTRLGDPYRVVRAAQEILVSMMPGAATVYYELDGDTWRARAQAGQYPPEVQAIIDDGRSYSEAQNLVAAWETREALFVDAYDPATDARGHLLRDVSAAAYLPLVAGDVPRGLLTVTIWAASHGWSRTDRALILALGHSLELALEGANSTRALQERTHELERSNAELERFAYVASHDLQEPLRTIASFAGLLDQRYGANLDDQGRRYLGLVTRGAQRMKVLIDDLLVFSRLNTARAPLRAIEAAVPVQEAVARLHTLIEQSGARLELGALPAVLGDETELTQLFQNLIGNAVKFRREDATPVVRVDADEDGDMWRFRVADNGIGIERKYFDRVFDLFQRLHVRDHYEGTGLGLSIVRKIIERHGGRVWLESELGAGTTVHFTLRKPAANASA